MLRAILIISAMLAAACSGRENTPDDVGFTPDQRVVADGDNLPDGLVLFPCTDPGKSCNAHNPCAINPICSSDLKCKPQSMMSCNDGLACTADTCLGLGLCKNTPAAGWCLLPVKQGGVDGGAGADGGAPPTTVMRCFKAGDKKPGDRCMACDPGADAGAGDPTHWSPVNGGSCDDGNSCSKDDYCQNGTCKGIPFGNQCDDGYGCTDDLCDGKGGCLGSKLKKDYCLINGSCYKDKANHPSGTCFTCDVTAIQSAWTPIKDTCLIGGKCYKKGDTNPAGCGECAPSVSATSWSVTGTTCCLISGVGYKSGVKDSTGCSICDPAADTAGWTLLTTVCKIGGKCYQKGDKNPGASCGECDPATNQTDWTVVGTTCCWINKTAYLAGATDTGACATCDPTKDKYAWTPLPNLCKISGTCYKPGDLHTQGCAKCDPTQSATSWTVTKAGYCVVDGECHPLCNGSCINLSTSSANCGTCGFACATGKVCKAGKCVVPCTMVADLETGSWPTSIWTAKASGGTVSTAAAHDGTYGLVDPGWHYEVTHQTGKVGEKLTAWTRFPSTKGRTYFGFAASAAGAYSFVFAPNTGGILFQKNTSYGYSDLTKLSVTLTANTWYLLQVEFLTGGVAKGTVFASDGKTVVATLSETIGGSLVGGVAIRGFSGHHVDTIKFCQ